MLKSGDVLDLGVDTKVIVRKTASDTDGQSFEMEMELSPRSGGTPIHTHPHAVETYEVLEGEFDVYLDGEWRTLSVGEKAAAEKGVRHIFRNSSDEITRVYDTHQPGFATGNTEV